MNKNLFLLIIVLTFGIILLFFSAFMGMKNGLESKMFKVSDKVIENIETENAESEINSNPMGNICDELIKQRMWIIKNIKTNENVTTRLHEIDRLINKNCTK
jgi:hypothetical protein